MIKWLVCWTIFRILKHLRNVFYLLVVSNCITTVADDIANMKDGAVRNNMRIHPTKTKELVICRTRFRLPPTTPCPFIEGAERVDSLRVLGVQLDSRLSMGDHITKILNTVGPTHLLFHCST